MHKQKNETDVPFWIGQSFFTPSCAFFMLLCECVYRHYTVYKRVETPLKILYYSVQVVCSIVVV